MNMKHIVGACALAAVACSAGATTIDWGDHGVLEMATNTVSTGSFTDYVNFSLSGNKSLSETTVSTNLSPLLGITNGEISLFAHLSPSNDVLLKSFSFSGVTGSTTNLFPATGPGDYFYKITGVATGSMGGFYSVASSAAAPVPEPRTGALFLSALAAVGLIFRRSNRH